MQDRVRSAERPLRPPLTPAVLGVGDEIRFAGYSLAVRWGDPTNVIQVRDETGAWQAVELIALAPVGEWVDLPGTNLQVRARREAPATFAYLVREAA